MFNIAFAADPATTPSMWSSIGLIIPIFFLFWLFIVRPQSKKMKEHQNLIQTLKKGDKVLTHSGFIGKITKVNDNTFTVEIADNINVLLDKNYIARKYESTNVQNQNNIAK